MPGHSGTFQGHLGTSRLAERPDVPIRDAFQSIESSPRHDAYSCRASRPWASPWLPFRLSTPRVRKVHISCNFVVRQAGFEPATRCLEGTVEASRHVAWCHSMRRSAALMGADCGVASPEDWDCWLPLWLPARAGISVVRMSENSIGFALSAPPRWFAWTGPGSLSKRGGPCGTRANLAPGQCSGQMERRVSSAR
jgi:hypothetical protein